MKQFPASQNPGFLLQRGPLLNFSPGFHFAVGGTKLLLDQGALFAEGAAPFSVLFSEVTKIQIGLTMSFGVHWLQNKIFFSLHCIKTKAYVAQNSVNIHSGPDSKVMHSSTTRMCFSQSSVMMMDTSPVHRIWHAKSKYARDIHRS